MFGWRIIRVSMLLGFTLSFWAPIVKITYMYMCIHIMRAATR